MSLVGTFVWTGRASQEDFVELPQDNFSARILTDEVEGVFTDIDANNRNPGVDLLRHDVLLVFGAPCQLQSLAGQEHGRTIGASQDELENSFGSARISSIYLFASWPVHDI
jgi:hypothetical protein